MSPDYDVSLSWDAATDNVGVARYAVYRDGVFLSYTFVDEYVDASVAPGATHSYSVSALDSAGNESSQSEAIEVVVDTQAPSVPQGLAAIVNPDDSVSLSWDASTDDVAVDRYAVYRNGGLVDHTSVNEYVDLAVPLDQTHSYTVTALDAADNESDPSEAVEVTLGDIEAPTVPEGLAAIVNPDDSVSLSWDASTDDVAVDRYAVYRNGGLLDYTSVAEYVDLAVPSGTTHSYTVTALDAADNESDPSEAVEVTLGDAAAPTVPEGLSAQALSTTSVALTWTASTDDSGVVTYDVYRDVDLIGSTSETEFVDDTLAPGTAATYTVRARDDAGNVSDPSTSAEATTFPILFEDDFSLGDFSRWTSQTNMSVATPDSGTGGPAALAQSDGTRRSFATKALTDPQSTIFYRTKFRIDSQASVTNLLRLQNGTGTPILSVFSSASRNLMVRNDFTNSNLWSPKTLGLGAWHDLQVRASVADASSEVEVWLDGERVGQLSGTIQLGTNPVGQLMLGDNSLNRTYSVFFDDVAAAAGFID